MKQHIKWMGTILLVVFLTFSFLSCQNTPNVNEDGSYTITFVDYEGDIIQETTCFPNEACSITTPANPNNIGNRYFVRWSVWESEYANLAENTTIKPIYTLDNRVFVIANREVLFYSFFIMLGILTALMLGLREAKRMKVNQDALIDGFLWIVPVAILGARLWYVVFEWDQFIYGGFFPSILRALGFASGTLDFSTFGLSGLAIHGAFFTAIVCAYFYTKAKKINIYQILDLVAVGFIIAQVFGRWGNFFNQEAHGPLVGGITSGVANLSLEEQFNHLRYTIGLPEFIVNNMFIRQGFHSFSLEPLSGYYHPTFFYELFFNFIGFLIMLVLRRLRFIKFGELFSFYLIWYGANRIFIEILRTDPLTFVFLGITFRSAIVTSVLMIIGGIALSLWIRFKKHGEGYDTLPGFLVCPKKQSS